MVTREARRLKRLMLFQYVRYRSDRRDIHTIRLVTISGRILVMVSAGTKKPGVPVGVLHAACVVCELLDAGDQRTYKESLVMLGDLRWGTRMNQSR